MFDVLSAALSGAAGKPYPDILKERVLGPAGLEDTGEIGIEAAGPGREKQRILAERLGVNLRRQRAKWIVRRTLFALDFARQAGGVRR